MRNEINIGKFGGVVRFGSVHTQRGRRLVTLARFDSVRFGTYPRSEKVGQTPTVREECMFEVLGYKSDRTPRNGRAPRYCSIPCRLNPLLFCCVSYQAHGDSPPQHINDKNVFFLNENNSTWAIGQTWCSKHFYL